MFLIVNRWTLNIRQSHWYQYWQAYPKAEVHRFVRETVRLVFMASFD